MHVTFREMAQQMGMQSTRAILDEDIDICLNAAIIDKTRSILIENVGQNNYADKVIRQNTVISPINALRSLYKKVSLPADDTLYYYSPGYSKDENNSNYRKESDVDDWTLTTKDAFDDFDSSITYTKEIKFFSGIGNEVEPYHLTLDSTKVMLFTGFKVSYDNNALYDCRIIEAEDLGQTLRDFCNRAAPDAPIAVVFGDNNSIEVDLYTGRNVHTYTGESTFKKPKTIQYIYIAEPRIVRYDPMNPKNNVDCDLPAYLHQEIIDNAVQRYLISIGVGLGNNKQRNNREN